MYNWVQRIIVGAPYYQSEEKKWYRWHDDFMA